MKTQKFRPLNKDELAVLDKMRQRGALDDDARDVLAESLIAYTHQEPYHWTICMLSTPAGYIHTGCAKCHWKDEPRSHKDKDGKKVTPVYDPKLGEHLAFVRAIECVELVNIPIAEPEKEQPVSRDVPATTSAGLREKVASAVNPLKPKKVN